LVFLHPGVADRRCWFEVMAHLAPRHAAVAYDCRCFGTTPAADAPFVNTDDLEAVLDACVSGPAILIGNSQGGRIAIDFALLHPERVERLVLIAPAISGAPQADWPKQLGQGLVDALKAAEDRGDLDEVNRLEALIWLDGPHGPEGRVGGPTRALFLAMNRNALSNESAPRPVEPPSAFDRLEHLTMPVLVVAGTRDLELQRSRSRLLAERAPNGRLVELDGVAHVPQLEVPEVVASLIRDFIVGHSPVTYRTITGESG
jgi:pimeloyl-ACP methyl ester carboxylesterase